MSLLAAARPVSFILTSDRARAKPFYAGALGLPIVNEDDFAVTLGLADGAIIRLTDLPGYFAKEHTVLGWAVEDISATVTDLKARGIEFRVYDGFGQDELGIWTTPDGSTRVAWFTDPDGNVLSLTQFLKA